MKDIRINIKIPSATEINKDLDSILKKVSQNSVLDLKLDTTAFTKSIGEMSKALSSLKSQLGNFNILETMSDSSKINDVTNAIKKQNKSLEEQSNILKTSNTFKINSDGTQSLIKEVTKIKDEYNNVIDTVDKFDSKTGMLVSSTRTVTDEIEKQRLATEKQEKALANSISNMQGKLNISSKNGLIDDSVITGLQGKLNSLTTDTPIKEINELKATINNLSGSDNGIVRLQNAIVKYGITIDSLKGRYGDIVPEKELNEAIVNVDRLKETMKSLQNGENISKTTLSSTLNQGSSSMKALTSATKNANDQQRLYNKEVISFGGAFKDVASKIGIFSLVYTGINATQNAFKEGIRSIVEMDTELSNLAKVVDMTDSQLLKMRDSAVSMGQELGRSATQVAAAQAEFGRLYKDMATINEMTQASIIGANVMDGTNADEVAKGLSTIISSMKLEAKDAMVILDSLNEVQNNYRISASSMLDGLAEVGSVARTAGLDLQELEGILTAISVGTGKSGNEVGTSVNSMLSRLYRTGLGGMEDDGKSEKALTSIGVAVRDMSGEFRKATDIFNDIDKVWGGLTQTQKIFTATQVAGTTQFNEFMTLFDNYDMAISATATALDSMGSATKENEIYISSINGKMQSLKATTEGFWFNFIDSDMIKGGVDALTGLVGVMDKLQTTFGGVGSTVGVLSTAFLMFTNNPLKGFANDTIKHMTTLGGFTDKLNIAKKAIADSGTTMSVTQKATTLLGVGFDGLGIKALATQVKVMALQMALSFGLGLAITAAVSGLTKLISAMTSGGKSMEDSQEQADALASSLDNVSKERDLSNQYKDIATQLKDANLEETKRNELKSSLDGIMKELLAAEEGYYGILKNENLTLEEQLEKMEQIRQARLFDESRDLDKDMLSQDDIEGKVKQLKEYTQSFNDIQNAVNSGNGENLVNLIGVSDVNEANEILGHTKNKINELDGEILSYNSSVALMNDSNYETSRSLITLDAETNSFISSLNESTNAIKANEQAKESNNSSGSGFVAQDIAELTKAYSESIEKLTELHKLVEQVNEAQTITPELVMSLASKYPELGANIQDTAYVQQFLNDKIAEEAEISRQAHQIMTENDAAYFNAKVKNTSEWEKYTVDVLNNIKNANVDYYNKNIEGMRNDLKNAQSLAESRAILETNLVKSLAQLWADYYTKISSAGWYTDAPVYQYAAPKGTKAYAETQAYLEQYNKITSKAKELANTFSSFSSSAFVPFTAGNFTGLSGGTGSGSDKSKASEKEIKNIEKLSDRYSLLQNRLDQVNNSLRDNKTIMENSNDENKLKYLDKEIKLLKDQKVALENIRKEREKELAEQKKLLQSKGFKFGGDGVISNETSRLDSLVNWSNSLSGDKKENAIASVKDIAETVKSYTSLLLKDIPDVTNEIKELTNATIDSQKEIADILKKQRETAIENMEKETDSLKKEIEKRKALMNKSWEDDTYQDELKKKQDGLLDLNSQLQDAMRMADNELITSIKKQIENAQSEINSFIGDNEKDKANDRFDEELNNLDEDLQSKIDTINSKLSDEQILVLVQNGVRDLDNVLNDVDLSTNKVVNTFSSIGNIIKNDWIGSINVFADKMRNLLSTDMNIKGTVTSGDKKSNSEPIVINLENKPVINGTGMSKDEIEDLLETNNEKLIKILANAINNR